MTFTTDRSSAIAELFRDGWSPGQPAHVPTECVWADIECYRTMECELCGAHSHTVSPYHRGREYTLLIQCRTCGFCTEG